MSQKRSYSSSYPENPPEWYWVRALHDACIVGVEMFEFPFDYNKFIQEKDKYNRNLLTLKIDASSAMFDTSVREIRFFNYKILTFCQARVLLSLTKNFAPISSSAFLTCRLSSCVAQ